MTLSLDHTPYDRCRAAVAAASDRLAADRRRIDARVTGFLAAGWRGGAATSFAAAWDDWSAAADEVRHGLASMAALLEAVHRDVDAQDAAAAASLAPVSARLTERLG
jgi:WXG100 family type VII secretion target